MCRRQGPLPRPCFEFGKQRDDSKFFVFVVASAVFISHQPPLACIAVVLCLVRPLPSNSPPKAEAGHAPLGGISDRGFPTRSSGTLQPRRDAAGSREKSPFGVEGRPCCRSSVGRDPGQRLSAPAIPCVKLRGSNWLGIFNQAMPVVCKALFICSSSPFCSISSGIARVVSV